MIKKVLVFFTLFLIFKGCGSTSSSNKSKSDLLLDVGIDNPILVVKDMRKDIKITSSKKDIVFKIVDKKPSDNFSMIDQYRGILTYWADFAVGTTQDVVVEASNNEGWKSAPLTLTFHTISKNNISLTNSLMKTGANDGGIGRDRVFTVDSKDNVIDSLGNVWENNITGKGAEEKFYLLAENKCTVLRLTNNGSHWRVPTVDELLNLIDYSKEVGSSMISSPFAPSDTTLWAESSNAKYIAVSQANGLAFDVKSTSKYQVRCINMPKSKQEHIVSSGARLNSVTFDFSTGLQWSPISKDFYTIDDNASGYCAQYDEGSGWRLPSINEIRSVVENGAISHSIVNRSGVVISSTPYNAKGRKSHYVMVLDDSAKIGVSYTDALYPITCVKKIEN